MAGFTGAGTNGLWTVASFNENERWTDNTIWTGALSVQPPVSVPDVAQQPRYIIEWLATVQRSENGAMLNSSYQSMFDRIEVFRVTARGVGGTANSQVLLQSTYGMIF